MKVYIVAILLSFFVIGCAGGIVGLGGTYKVSYSDEDMIMFEYDSDLTSIKKLVEVAKKHCSQYGKKAIPETPASTNWNSVGSFKCNCK